MVGARRARGASREPKAPVPSSHHSCTDLRAGCPSHEPREHLPLPPGGCEHLCDTGQPSRVSSRRWRGCCAFLGATDGDVLGGTPPWTCEAALCLPGAQIAAAAGWDGAFSFPFLHRWHELIILVCVTPSTSVGFFQNVRKQMITSVFVAVREIFINRIGQDHLCI